MDSSSLYPSLAPTAPFLRHAEEKVRCIRRSYLWLTKHTYATKYAIPGADPDQADFYYNSPSTSEIQSYGAQYGDLLVTPCSLQPEDTTRSGTVYVVTQDHKYAVIDDATICWNIAAYIQHPMRFYAAELGGHIQRIGLHYDRHAPYLREAIGQIVLPPSTTSFPSPPITLPITGRAVAIMSKYHLDFDFWTKSHQNFVYAIRGPQSFDIPEHYSDQRLWVALTPETPRVYLHDSYNSLAVDPVMELVRKQNRQLHEEDVADVLSKVDSVEISTDPNASIRGYCNVQLHRIERDSTFPRKVTSIYAGADKQGNPIRYTPAVLTHKGPYGGVKVWASKPLVHAGWHSAMRSFLQLSRFL